MEATPEEICGFSPTQRTIHGDKRRIDKGSSSYSIGLIILSMNATSSALRPYLA